MKTFYVEKLHDGARIEDIFIISGKSIGRTQEGAPFVRLKLTDRTGSIDAIKWDAPEAVCSGLAIDDYVHARGVVSKYKEKLQIVLDNVRKHGDRVDPTDFLPRCPKDTRQMMADLRTVIGTVQHPQLKTLLEHFFNDAAFVERFATAPAAQRIHHAYIGGLLEHSLSVAQLCNLVAGHYPEANRDLLVTAAILHDIGKIDEFSWSRSIRYTDSGHLVGHLVSGAMTVDEAAGKIADFHPFLRMILIHMILSHHGEKEFGSPKRPKSLESLILHRVEDLDAKVKTFGEAVSANGQSSDTDMWTEKHWLFERPLLRGLPEAVIGKSAADEEELPAGPGQAQFDSFAE
ncbi:MAG: HD domain-containing protein [Armatimonadota bacterium]|nr:HD domain-containing protein [Armatimonadota bacterium]